MKLKFSFRFFLLITSFFFMPFMMGASDLEGGVGCLGNLDTRTLGGTVSGLSGTVVLQNNGADNLSLTSDDSFTFTTPLADGSTYAVTVLTQPTGQTCSVSNASGTITDSNITNVAVTCIDSTYTLGGTVSGLSGTVVLQNNSGNDLSITADGSFTFTTALADASTYAVTVLTQPTGQTCSVSNGSGTISTSNVTDVTVTCVTDSFSVGGSVSGLDISEQVTLQNNGSATLAITQDGPYSYTLDYGSSYSIEVVTQPTNQTCTISGCSEGSLSGGVCSGTVTGTISDITITCVTGPT